MIFSKSADNGAYNEMYQYMANNPDVLTNSNKEGIERVKEERGGYAFFMESSSIEYIMERECSLTKVGGELDSKSYGIGMRKNFPFKDEINYAILKLQESGYMHKLKTKWWKQKGAKNCKAMREAASSTAKPLTVENVAGAFLVLVVGMAMATVTATTEFLWSYRGILNRENVDTSKIIIYYRYQWPSLQFLFQSDKIGNLKKEALSSFGRKGVKFNLNKSTSVLSSMSDVSTVQRYDVDT